jgi:hypothetical protein
VLALMILFNTMAGFGCVRILNFNSVWMSG